MPNITDANQNGNGEPEPRPNTRTNHEFAAAINGVFRRSVEDIHAIGRLLLEARIELASNAYLYMLHKQLDFGGRNARLYVKIARNPVLVKRQYISAQPNSLTKLVELTKLPLEYLEKLFERGKITPKIEIETIQEWVEEQKKARVDWDNAPAHLLWLADHFEPQYPEPGPQHARRIVTEDGFTFDHLTSHKDWINKLHAAYLELQEQERRLWSADDYAIEAETARLQAQVAQADEFVTGGYAAAAEPEEEDDE
jgi:hypothetical protein